jgi:phosphoribosylaminoimidazolecarboxamide formyltransferase/IMP cyclohydrolase
MRRRALLSVTDKAGVVEFARGLLQLGFELLSTGGTHRVLREAGVPALEVRDYTGFPEMMDGRVKTLHPRIHGGILARRDEPGDLESMEVHGIDPIDVVVVNLYRFCEAAERPGASRAEVIEQIDIGGPALIRSAAKNHADVAVVVDPADYADVLAALRTAASRSWPADLLRRLAAKAFAHTAAYDTAIAEWFDAEQSGDPISSGFGHRFVLCGDKLADLRYGENPHQAAAVYAGRTAGASLARAEQLGGKELSYNNLLDLDAALGVAFEFEEPACAIVKHGNPSGTAIARDTAGAFVAALDADPVSAFGGIVALNRELDRATAELMVERGTFVEAIVAPGVANDVPAVLGRARWGDNVRVLSLGGVPDSTDALAIRSISGGFLVQTGDPSGAPLPELRTVTARAPTAVERETLAFAWRVCKHVKSNAIVLARGDGDVRATVGIGAGQMSRVDSVRIAVDKAGPRAQGSVLASDAFFPFADGLAAGIAAGITAAIQPGGSKRDAEVVAAADDAGIAMVFTGMRHFRH